MEPAAAITFSPNDRTKLKAIADGKVNVAQKLKFVKNV